MPSPSSSFRTSRPGCGGFFICILLILASGTVCASLRARLTAIPELCPSGPAYLSNANAGARDQQHQSRECHQARKVKGNIAPARRNSLSRVERFIAISTQDEGCAVVQHFALYFGDECLDRRAVARHGLQMH